MLVCAFEQGFENLLCSKEPSLIKFVWEHAVGKPRDQVSMDANFQIEQITGMEFKKAESV